MTATTLERVPRCAGTGVARRTAMRAASILACFAPIALVACAADAGGCRSQSDCTSAEACVPPGAPRACGIPCSAMRTCASSADCASGDVCVEYVAPCCFAGELSSRCQPSCDAGSCPEGERCDAASGLCEVTPCDDGYECAVHTTCAPGAAGADAHGCVRDGCAGDGDCADGACVDGRCYEGPGSCEGPAP